VVMGVRILLLIRLLPVPIDLPAIGVVRPRGSGLRFVCRGGPPSRTSHGAMVEGPRLVVTGYLLPCHAPGVVLALSGMVREAGWES
jgi:hypothetical protein